MCWFCETQLKIFFMSKSFLIKEPYKINLFRPNLTFLYLRKRNETIGKKRLRTRIFIAELNSSSTVQFYTLEKKIFQKFGLNTADHSKLYLDQNLFEFFSFSCDIIFGKLSGSCYVAYVIPYI